MPQPAAAKTIIDINQALNNALNQYINFNGPNIDIRFDLPEINMPQSLPTISVFLYDIHEDLQLRRSEPRQINNADGSLNASIVHINCNYLITYWDANQSSSQGGAPESKPDNQAAKVMTLVLQALLNKRQLEGISAAYTRVIPPQENLNSLGNFWQALGNRPRLSLMYSITVPMMLDDTLAQSLIKTVTSDVIPTQIISAEKLSQLIKQQIFAHMTESQRMVAGNVNITTVPLFKNTPNGTHIDADITLSGRISQEAQNSISAWQQKTKSDAPALLFDNTEIYIKNIDTNKLIVS